MRNSRAGKISSSIVPLSKEGINLLKQTKLFTRTVVFVIPPVIKLTSLGKNF